MPRESSEVTPVHPHTFRGTIARFGLAFLLAASMPLGAQANQPPVAVDDSATTRDAIPVVIDVLANDSDPDGDPIRVVLGSPILTPPSHGSAVRRSDREIEYTPNAGFLGTDTFLYRIGDGAATHAAWVSVAVTSNRAPVAVDDRRSTARDQPITIDVTANDFDPDGDPIRVVLGTPILAPPSHGMATRVSDTSIAYSPSSGFRGTDAFQYRIGDGGKVHSAWVTVRVDNHAPVAVQDMATTHTSPVTIDVVANDTDLDGDTVTLIKGQAISQHPSHGWAIRASDQTITYTPNAGFFGTDTVRYIATDSWGAVAIGTLTIDVTNRAPIAKGETIRAVTGAPKTYNVVINDSDPDGDPIALDAIVGSPNHGTVVIVDDRKVTYTSNPGFTGNDSFVYRIVDSFGATDTAVASVVVSDLAPPEVDRVDDHVIHRGQARNLVVHGRYFEGASISIADATTNGGTSTQTFPGVALSFINEAGTRLEAAIDASDPNLAEGYYYLGIHHAGGVTSAPFRIVGQQPIIDMMTPSEPIVDKLHMMEIAGVNLAGANIVPSHPGLQILELDNSEDGFLSGLLHVGENVPAGPQSLHINGPGGSAVVPIDTRPHIAAATKATTDLRGDGPESNPALPEIYLQMPVAMGPEAFGMAGSTPDGPASGGGPSTGNHFNGCLNFEHRRGRSWRRTILSLFDDIGDPLLQSAVNALQPGQKLDFTSRTLSTEGWLEFSFSGNTCVSGNPGGPPVLTADVNFCLRGGYAIQVPGLPGKDWVFDICKVFTRVQELAAGGHISSHTYTSKGACANATDLNPSSTTGSRPGELQTNCCEETEITLESAGIGLSGVAIFDGGTITVTPTCHQPPPNGEIGLGLEEVSFLDDHSGLRKDQIGSYEEIEDPVWIDSNHDSVPETNEPVAYTRGTAIKLLAKLKVDRAPNSANQVTIEARGPDNIVLLGLAFIDDSGTTEVQMTTGTGLPDMTKDYVIPGPVSGTPRGTFQLQWSYSVDGNAFTPFGTSAHRLFVTLDRPVGTSDRRSITAYALATGNGGATDERTAVEETWRQFARPDSSGPANITTWQGRRLYYYPEGVNSVTCASDSKMLLMSSNGAGQCGSFMHLFRDALALNGIIGFQTTARAIDRNGFVVKNWGIDGTTYHGPGVTHPHQFRVYFVDNRHTSVCPHPVPRKCKEPDEWGDLVHESGVAGQNTPTPAEKIFNNHQFVKLNTPGLPDRYFDPSYGLTYHDERDFEQKAIKGYYKPRPQSGNTILQVRQVDQTLNIKFN